MIRRTRRAARPRRDEKDDEAAEERRRLEEFADAAIHRAEQAPEEYRFGRHKVFIAFLEPNRVTRRRLVEAHRAHLLQLSRLDLSPAVKDKAMMQDSEVSYDLGHTKAVWHLIDLEYKQPKSPSSSRDPRSKMRSPHRSRWIVSYTDQRGRIRQTIVETVTRREAIVAGHRIASTGRNFIAFKQPTKPLRR